jgi:hypothetical protein
MFGELLRKLLGENQSLKAGLAALLALGGGTIGVVANGKQFMDIVDGKDDQLAIAEKAVEQQRESMAAIAAATAENETTKADARAWAIASEQKSVAGYDFYLQSYPQGLFADQAAKAKEALEKRGSGSPFALEQVNASVAPVVQAARAAKENALAKQASAESVIAAAELAASQAKAKAKGYRTIALRDGATFDGQSERSSKPTGVGVMVQSAGEFAGDRFAGAFVEGRWQGLGVYEAAQPAEGRPRRYVGEFQDGHLAGAGFMLLADGARAMGAVVDGRMNGPAVVIYPDGRRYEGEFKLGRKDGLGVLWSGSGQAMQMGRFADDVLIEPMAR